MSQPRLVCKSFPMPYINALFHQVDIYVCSPVVCGTPGSLVHFYNTLADIAFNSTLTTLARTAFLTSGSTYDQLESALIRATSSNSNSSPVQAPATSRVGPHVVPRKDPASPHRHYLHPHRHPHRFHKRAAVVPPPSQPATKTAASIKAELKLLLKEYAGGLELSRQCGGKGIPNCYWKSAMVVRFILRFSDSLALFSTLTI